jgi:hypothetical protein
MKGQNRTSHSIKLSIYGKGKLFGFEDVENMRNNLSDVKCISETGSLFCMTAREFIARFSKDERAWEELKSISKESDM